MGRSASVVLAWLPALSPRRAGRSLADHPDEPHRSGLFSGRLHRPGCGRRGRIDWTSSPSTARPRDEATTVAPTRPAPPGLCLRDDQPPCSRSGSGCRQDQRNHRHSAPAGAVCRARTACKERWSRSMPSRRTPTIAIGDPGRAGRLSPGREGQPADPALRDRDLLCRRSSRQSRDHTDVDKGDGRIEQRTVTVAREVDWLDGDRRFPGELRLPDVATIVRVASRAELKDRGRFETRYYVSSAALSARARGRGRAQPLGYREQPALGTRCHLR